MKYNLYFVFSLSKLISINWLVTNHLINFEQGSYLERILINKRKKGRGDTEEEVWFRKKGYYRETLHTFNLQSISSV